jgi:hypothetical protein
MSIEMRPKAVVQGKVDRNRSFYEKLIEYPLASTNNYTQDGDAMIFTVESGINQQVVDRCAGAAYEKFAGVAMSDYRRITDFVDVQEGTVPLAGAYTIQLKKGSNVVAGTFNIVDSTGAGYTDTSPVAPSAATEYAVDANGVVTFHSGAAGKVVTIRSTYTPTQVELSSRFPAPAFVQRGQTFLNQVAVAVGHCEIFTTQYETADAWALNEQVYLGASGKFDMGAGTNRMVVGRVISLPGVGDPYLGVQYNVGTSYNFA